MSRRSGGCPRFGVGLRRSDVIRSTSRKVAAPKELRADGRRNRERIVVAAEALFERDGAQASLEAIARNAGVGSATLHRHFPSRGALLEAVFRDSVAALCARADAKPGDDPGEELFAWLEELTVYTATHRGLATALLTPASDIDPGAICATDLVRESLDRLVRRAATAGALRPEATTEDLMILANAIGVATENDAPAASRLVRLAMRGARRPKR